MNKEKLQKLFEIVRRVKQLEVEIKNDSFLRRDLSYGSLDFVDLLFELDQAFDIELTMFSLNQFILGLGNRSAWDLTVVELLNYIEAQGASK